MNTPMRSMFIEIEIDTADFAVFAAEFGTGMPIPIPDLPPDSTAFAVLPAPTYAGGVGLIFQLPKTEVITLLVTVGKPLGDIAIGVIAAWLYDKLKGKPKKRKIRINQTDVRLTKKGLTRIIKTSFESEED